MRRIAFFDFDGTITTHDTMFGVIKHLKGNARFYTGFLLNIPVFAALKLKRISAQTAKEKLLTHFFNRESLSDFQAGCDSFIDSKLPALIRPQALSKIKSLQQSGFEVVVVSASAENWIKKWADEMGLGLIATQLEIIDGKLTGKLSGENCNGEEKATRIRDLYDRAQFEEIYCYGDSAGDRQMLQLGTKSFYKPFRG